MLAKHENRQIYLEFIAMGQQVKVTAIDSRTGIEAIIVAPKHASQEHMKNSAVAKLKWQLEKMKKNGDR